MQCRRRPDEAQAKPATLRNAAVAGNLGLWTAPRPMGMTLAATGALELARADMRGSNPREYVSKDGTQVTLFSIRLGGRTRWGWFSIDAGGALRGYSKTF